MGSIVIGKYAGLVVPGKNAFGFGADRIVDVDIPAAIMDRRYTYFHPDVEPPARTSPIWR